MENKVARRRPQSILGRFGGVKLATTSSRNCRLPEYSSLFTEQFCKLKLSTASNSNVLSASLADSPTFLLHTTVQEPSNSSALYQSPIQPPP